METWVDQSSKYLVLGIGLSLYVHEIENLFQIICPKGVYWKIIRLVSSAYRKFPETESSFRVHNNPTFNWIQSTPSLRMFLMYILIDGYVPELSLSFKFSI